MGPPGLQHSGVGRACVPCFEGLLGEPVESRDGIILGRLAHVLFDVHTGRIACGVVARGGVLGLGERLHPLPWSLLRRDPESGTLVAGIDGDRVEDSPWFDRSRWELVEDSAWRSRALGFYGRATRASAKEVIT